MKFSTLQKDWTDTVFDSILHSLSCLRLATDLLSLAYSSWRLLFNLIQKMTWFKKCCRL